MPRRRTAREVTGRSRRAPFPRRTFFLHERRRRVLAAFPRARRRRRLRSRPRRAATLRTPSALCPRRATRGSACSPPCRAQPRRLRRARRCSRRRRARRPPTRWFRRTRATPAEAPCGAPSARRGGASGSPRRRTPRARAPGPTEGEPRGPRGGVSARRGSPRDPPPRIPSGRERARVVAPGSERVAGREKIHAFDRPSAQRAPALSAEASTRTPCATPWRGAE